MEGESFIGGFANGFLSKGFLHVGYGLYFTTRRVIGIDMAKNGGGALGGTMAGFIKGQLMPKLSTEESANVIARLEGMKEFDMVKEQIRTLSFTRVCLELDTS